jgi:hypothetical protein
MAAAAATFVKAGYSSMVLTIDDVGWVFAVGIFCSFKTSASYSGSDFTRNFGFMCTTL